MNKSPLYMETTKKEPEETAADIQKMLKNYNLQQFMCTYTNGEITGVFFHVFMNERYVSYKLPIRHKAITRLALDGELKYAKTETQAKRVAWRQVLRWIEAQLSLIQIGMVTFDEVFLPYMLVDNNTTVYKMLSNTLPQLGDGSSND